MESLNKENARICERTVWIINWNLNKSTRVSRNDHCSSAPRDRLALGLQSKSSSVNLRWSRCSSESILDTLFWKNNFMQNCWINNICSIKAGLTLATVLTFKKLGGRSSAPKQRFAVGRAGFWTVSYTLFESHIKDPGSAKQKVALCQSIFEPLLMACKKFFLHLSAQKCESSRRWVVRRMC